MRGFPGERCGASRGGLVAPRGRRRRDGGHAARAELRAPRPAARLKDSVAERPNHSNLCTSEFRQTFVRIQENFSRSFRNSENFRISMDFSTFSRIFNEIPRKFHQCLCKIRRQWWKIRNFAEIRTKIWKSLTKICEYFEFGAVRRCANLVHCRSRKML